MKTGTIGWIDLTINGADSIRDFYQDVVGWSADPVDMGEYNDYAMAPADGGPVAGICHARGANADQPPTWTIYIVVEDLDQSLEKCERLGGKRITKIRTMGHDRYCVIEDPSGATCALYQSGE